METSLQAGKWSSIVLRVGEIADLEATARSFGALQRVRKVRRAEDLLRLALMYGPGHLSLRTTAAMAAEAAIVELSDKGVLGRLRKMGDWLEHLLQRRLEQRRGLACGEAALNLALVDGSVICAPGSTGSDWRLHARFDPGRGCFADLVLTQGQVAERVDPTQIQAGQTVIQDRGYARVRDFSAVLAAKADFITRIGWNALRLIDATGQRIDRLKLLPQSCGLVEHLVYIKGLNTKLRLVIQAIPAEHAERQRRRVARKDGRRLFDPGDLAVGPGAAGGAHRRDVSQPLADRAWLQTAQDAGRPRQAASDGPRPGADLAAGPTDCCRDDRRNRQRDRRFSP